MKPRLLISAALAAATLLGGLAAATTASAAPGEKRQCFYSRNVNGYQAVDDQTVNIRVGVKDIYQLTLLAPSSDIDWAWRIGIESRGGSFICSGLDATLIVPTDIGPQRFPVSQVRKLSANEVAALPRKQRP